MVKLHLFADYQPDAAVDYQPPHPTHLIRHRPKLPLLHPAAANRLRPGRRKDHLTVSCDILCRDDFHQASSMASRAVGTHVPSGCTR
ncbi:hypothetical protein EVAR_78762_1 [Eumeta japonica]|uniref:Uncharacterized protein n=1 Tax=Eumeta variegata TaxID=151549 RepID=A0A4C1T237_EUMVA|nr:hypothetical protein EVAR_78762_1 [Eumeta japonica]